MNFHDDRNWMERINPLVVISLLSPFLLYAISLLLPSATR